MNSTNLPISIESLLDLVTPELIKQIIDYQVTVPHDTVDDWEPRHINAAEQLINYVEKTYPTLRTQSDKLLTKLELNYWR